MNTSVRARAFRLIVLLGLASLFGDITYEGVRGVTGPYLGLLGASAATVGLVAGLGEFLGYALRTVAGYVADRLRLYWFFTFFGYALVGVLPLLALTHRWEWAATLIVLERFGKALRTPSRDAILSHAASQVGQGKGFGLHEALDQAGALIGPLLFAAALAIDGVEGYRLGFAILAIPALATIVTVFISWRREPEPEHLETHVLQRSPRTGKERLGGAFWRYTIFTGLVMLGFGHFALLSYHMQKVGAVHEAVIPLLYAAAMGVDGIIALFAGWAYDRFGLVTLAAVPVCAALAALGVFQTSVIAVVLGVLFWGVAMGLTETSMRAAVGELSAPGVRGFAYGIFNTTFGLSWLAGGLVLGWLYQQVGTAGAITAAVSMQTIALFAFFALGVVRSHREQKERLAS